MVHPVNGEVPPVKGRPWKLPHYANRGKTSSSGGELASARSCFSTVRTALGKLRITGLLARFDVARSFPQFPRPLLLQPTIWTSERGADLGSGRCQPRPHLPIYRMTQKYLVLQENAKSAWCEHRPHFRRAKPWRKRPHSKKRWQEAVDGLLHHRPPGSILGFIEIGVTFLELVPIVLETLVEGGPLRMTGPVGCRRRHALPETNASSNL